MRLKTAATIMWLVLLSSLPPFLYARPLMNPQELRSRDGLLDVYLVAEQAEVMFDDNIMVSLMTWNGSYVPPTLRLLPGDGFRLTIVNRLTETTNVHFHGLVVSPNLPADDSLYQLPAAKSPASGSSFTYTFRIPSDHAPGLYFYHSHSSNSEMQVFQGLSGLIVIEGLLSPFSVDLQQIREQFFSLKDLQIQNGTIPKEIDLTVSTIRTINGIMNPTVTIRPNELQFWRIANVGADILYKLHVSNVTMFEVARDGRLLNQPVALMSEEGYFLGPGSRAEFLVIGPPVGVYMLRSLAIQNGDHGPSYPEVDLAVISSEGNIVTSPPSVPDVSQFPTIIDLRLSKLSTKRVIEYTMVNSSGSMSMTTSSGTSMNAITTATTATSVATRITSTKATTSATSSSMTTTGMAMGRMRRQNDVSMMTMSGGSSSSDYWMINDRMYDPNRIDVTVSLGSTELWIIRNCDEEYHVRGTVFEIFATLTSHATELSYPPSRISSCVY